MAEKRRFLDVWLVETNTVYREVPFAVVADWVQQSRLVPEDMLRPSGTAQWFRVGSSPDFAPYIPRSEPHRVEDRAEALEPVQLDFAWKSKRDDEDDDVDMIPLIDISLVLLIFFIMTGGIAGAFLIDTPSAYNGLVVSDPRIVWIGIDLNNQHVESGEVRELLVKLAAYHSANKAKGRLWFIPKKYISVSEKG